MTSEPPPSQTHADHEAKCRRCGRCCRKKIIYQGRVFYTPYPCEHLDVETRLCKVYDQRHVINPQCLSVEDGLKLGVFPPDCPYVKSYPNYKAPVVHTITKELAELIETGKVDDL